MVGFDQKFRQNEKLMFADAAVIFTDIVLMDELPTLLGNMILIISSAIGVLLMANTVRFNYAEERQKMREKESNADDLRS